MSFLALLPLVGKVFDRVFPDPKQAADAKLKLLDMSQKGDLAELDADVRLAVGQMEVNKQEAQHSSIFVAGWRTFVGWTCGVALAYSFILLPLMQFIAVIAEVDISKAPVLAMGELMTVLLGILGLGGMRSYEKRNGVAQQRLKPQSE